MFPPSGRVRVRQDENAVVYVEFVPEDGSEPIAMPANKVRIDGDGERGTILVQLALYPTEIDVWAFNDDGEKVRIRAQGNPPIPAVWANVEIDGQTRSFAWSYDAEDSLPKLDREVVPS